MTKLDWEKANKRERVRLTGGERRRNKYGERGAAIAQFARKHKIGCFVCTDTEPEQWAKSGINKKGPWVICLECARWRSQTQSGK